MRILLSPAKKMKTDDCGPEPSGLPVFWQDARIIRDWLREKSFAELKKLWACNDRITQQNMDRLAVMNLRTNLTPAIMAYDGIAFQYMAPTVFETRMLTYVQEHLRILSGFYGVLKPMDGVTPYRLEMQAKAEIAGTKDLYEYWGDRLYGEVCDSSGIIINLASREYFRCIEKYLRPENTCITCTFAEEEKGRMVQKGVYCKMARGEMVRFMAEHGTEAPEEIREFDRLGYRYHGELSSETEYVFLREGPVERMV